MSLNCFVSLHFEIRRTIGKRARRPRPWSLHLFAVLVCHDRTRGRARVGAKYEPIFEQAADNSRTGAGSLWHLDTFVLKESIATRALFEPTP